jgi:hypothetical protein
MAHEHAFDVIVDELEAYAGVVRTESGGTAVLEPRRFRNRDYLFKRYEPEYVAQLAAKALSRLIAWRGELPDADRQQLDGYAAWPRYRVCDRGGQVLGLLTPCAHETYFHRHPTTGALEPRTLETLRMGTRSVPIEVKLNAFGRLIEAVGWLHRHGVVVNDLQPQNALYSRFGDAVLLVDCDSMTGAHWAPVLPLVQPVTFAEMRTASEPRPATDWAKLAVIVMQTMLEDEVEVPGAREATELTRLLTVDVADFVLHAIDPTRYRDTDRDRWAELGRRWRQTRSRASAAVPVPVPPPVPRSRSVWYDRRRTRSLAWPPADLGAPPDVPDFELIGPLDPDLRPFEPPRPFAPSPYTDWLDPAPGTAPPEPAAEPKEYR